MSLPGMYEVLDEVAHERQVQDNKWGEQNHPDGTGCQTSQELATFAREVCDRAARDGTATWSHILDEEAKEALAESDPVKLRAELVQVAAVAVNWIQAIDRRSK